MVVPAATNVLVASLILRITSILSSWHLCAAMHFESASIRPGFFFVTLYRTVTKMRRKTRKCRYCGEVFVLNQKGRIREYCRPSHRVRAFEKRRQRRANQFPFELLRTDLKAASQNRQVIRGIVIDVLKEVLPSLFRDLDERRLHLVKGGGSSSSKAAKEFHKDESGKKPCK